MSGSDTHSRRGFLGALGGFAAGMALDPDRVLWRAGAKVISIPSKRRSFFTLFEMGGQVIFPVYSNSGKLKEYAAYPADSFDEKSGSFDAMDVIHLNPCYGPIELAQMLNSSGLPLRTVPFGDVYVRSAAVNQARHFYA